MNEPSIPSAPTPPRASFSRWLHRIIASLIQIAITVYAVVWESPYAGNFLIAATWLVLVLALVFAIATARGDAAMTKVAREQERAFPRWSNRIISILDKGLGILLICYGWWWTAFAHILSSFLQYCARHYASEEYREQKKKEAEADGDSWEAAGLERKERYAKLKQLYKDEFGSSPELFNLRQYLERQKDWSLRTFGPAPRTQGIIQHITKELEEIRQQPGDLMEWIDVAILALDGAWRAGHTPRAIVAALQAKQDKNVARQWPAWEGRSEDEAIEHDRSTDKAMPAVHRCVRCAVAILEGEAFERTGDNDVHCLRCFGDTLNA